MSSQGGGAEADLVVQCLGRRRRHAELGEELQPLRPREKRPEGDLREDTVEGSPDVREEDRDRFLPAGSAVQENLDGDGREVGPTPRHGTKLVPLGLCD